MHELGHALYEQGLPPTSTARRSTTRPRSGRTSRSRASGRTRSATPGVLGALEPALRRRFPEAMTGLDPALLHRAASRRPSLIRVEADEVTYNLHIVLRFEIELALIRGDLDVEDLLPRSPTAWSASSGSARRATPSAPCRTSTGRGLFGYFPTYTLGNLYAQLAEAADAELGGIERAVEEGACATSWNSCGRRVHRHGAR